MSKEAVRKLVEGRLASFTFENIKGEEQSYPNIPNQPIPAVGRWLRLHDIEFVMHKEVGMGSEPYTRRTGVIVIDVFERLDMGTKKINELTDALETYFYRLDIPDFWTKPGNTVNFPNEGDKPLNYRSRVYVPFTYDEG